jgi:type IV pilus assembly protein PilC
MAESAVMGNVPFLWEGTDRKGNKIKGKSMAPDEAQVRADLRRQGVVPSRIKKQGRGLKRGGSITTADIAIFSRQLATMLAAGIPLVQAFEIVGHGHENPAMQKLILAVKSDVVNLVSAGEQAGALETLLDKIATYKEKTEAIKKKIKKAITYPAAVLVVAFVVTIILLIFVIPAFEDLFKGFGADLPAFTRMVIDLSVFVRTQGWILALLAGAGVTTNATFPGSPRAQDADCRPDSREGCHRAIRPYIVDHVQCRRTPRRSAGIRRRSDW